tara:strand:- start:45 stop:641 length:597 start_codon:yes stop_codon:yes gene_type:complete
MKKLVLPLLLLCPLATFAIDDLEYAHDITVSSGKMSLGYDQDGDELKVGFGAASVYHSTATEIGVEFKTRLIGGLTGSAHYEYSADEDSIVGVDTAVTFGGVKVDTGVEWNISDADWTGTLGTGYSLAGVDGSITSNWGISDFGYEGMDIDVGYNWQVSDRLSVRPNVTMPIDEDNEFGTVVAGLSLHLTFGVSTSIE